MQTDKNIELESGEFLIRHNKGKTEFNLVDFDFVAEMAKVMMFGRDVKGYPEGNWKKPFKNPNDVDNSRIRHCLADLQGEIFDSESGLSHLAHEAVNCMIKYYQIKKSLVK